MYGNCKKQISFSSGDIWKLLQMSNKKTLFLLTWKEQQSAYTNQTKNQL